MAVLLEVAPFRLVEELTASIIRVIIITLMMEAVRVLENSVSIYLTTRCNIPCHPFSYSPP
jgi:hypothetical protein